MCKSLVCLSVIFGFLVLSPVSPCPAQDFEDLTLVQLERQLNAILKTRRPEEKAFVKEVVKGIEDETIPRRLVNISFKYVRNKRPYTRYPFVYFVRVLQIVGAKEEVTIPKFDFKIFSQRS